MQNDQEAKTMPKYQATVAQHTLNEQATVQLRFKGTVETAIRYFHKMTAPFWILNGTSHLTNEKEPSRLPDETHLAKS